MPHEAGVLLDIIAGRDTDALIEVRCRRPHDGKITARDWFTDRDACQRFMVAHACSLDVYVGAAPRTRRDGGKAAVAHGWCLWADIDTPEALALLRGFRPYPSLVIRSGSGAHAYWKLSEPLPPAWLERANRRLAHILGADMRATDAARILRPPGTLNWKHDPPVSVTIEYYQGSQIIPVTAVKNLPDPAPNPPLTRPRSDVSTPDPLLGVSADRYYSVLTGLPVTRGNVTCPFHGEGRERNPSMRLYDGGTFYCFSCGVGGSVIQFAAHLWGYSSTRGANYREIRERLVRELQCA